MKKSRLLFVLFLILLVFVYIINGSHEMAMVLILFGMITVINALLCILSGRKLHVQILLPETLEKGQQTEGSVLIRNGSVVPVLYGQAEVEWENRLTGEKGRVICPFGVLPWARTETFFELKAIRCGACCFTIRKIRVFDLFRIFSGKRKIQEENQVLVFPAAEEAEIRVVDREAYDMESFRYSEYKKGDDSSETFDIREYISGDSIRNIHWKLTGKMDSVMIRESSFPVFNSLLLLWETGYTKKEMPEKTDAAAEVFVSVADMLIRKRMVFEIGYYDYGKEFFCTERIESTEDLWNVVPAILKAGRSLTGHSAYYQYQMNCGDRAFAHYMYVSGGGAFEDLSLISEGDPVTLLCCGEQYLHEGNTTIFTSENWKEELA